MRDSLGNVSRALLLLLLLLLPCSVFPSLETWLWGRVNGWSIYWGKGGGVDACFSLIPLSTPPWDLPFHPSYPLPPFLSRFLTTFFFLIISPAEPARFTGFNSVYTGTARDEGDDVWVRVRRGGGGEEKTAPWGASVGNSWVDISPHIWPPRQLTPPPIVAAHDRC